MAPVREKLIASAEKLSAAATKASSTATFCVDVWGVVTRPD